MSKEAIAALGEWMEKYKASIHCDHFETGSLGIVAEGEVLFIDCPDEVLNSDCIDQKLEEMSNV